MRIIISLVLAFSIFSECRGQKVEKIFLDPGDSTRNLYVALRPPKGSFASYIFIIPGMFQTPEEVLRQSDLPKTAAQQGVLAIIPTFATGIGSLGIDSATQKSFLRILADVAARFKITNQRFYVGGFSIGGTCAIKYAELALKNNYPVKPTAVFAIDSPLDFERMFTVSKRELSFPGLAEELAAENKYMLNRMTAEFGGAPDRVQSSYHKHSPYSFSDTTRQAIMPLINLPIRLYTEPDLQFWSKQGVDYYGMNAVDLAALASDLTKMGNKRVTVITSIEKGFRRPNHDRNPHSWSIAEPADLMKWLLYQQ